MLVNATMVSWYRSYNNGQAQSSSMEPDNALKKHCFILSNNKFPRNDMDLPGYTVDVADIKTTFSEHLNFLVHDPAENATTEEMVDVFQRWSSIDFSNTKCIVVFILTHGDDDGDLIGRDGKVTNINKLVGTFSSCKSLKGVAKIYFVQACRGHQNPTAVQCGVRAAGLGLGDHPRCDDTIMYYATAAGFKSYVSDQEGSIFISTLCKVLRQRGAEYTIGELVTVVNNIVGKSALNDRTDTVAQSPEVAYTLLSDIVIGEKKCEDRNKDAETKIVELELKKTNLCYIFTNTSCETHKTECENFKKDESNIAKTFELLNFQVIGRHDSSKVELESTFSVLKEEIFMNLECVVFVIFSCGGLEGNKPIIWGSDGIFYNVNTMMTDMNENKSLVGKPKLFLLVTKKCTRDNFLRAACHQDPCMLSEGADSLLYKVAIKDGETESSFITKLSEVLLRSSKQGLHLGNIIHQVNTMMSHASLDVPEVIHTLRSQIYFKRKAELYFIKRLSEVLAECSSEVKKLKEDFDISELANSLVGRSLQREELAGRAATENEGSAVDSDSGIHSSSDVYREPVRYNWEANMRELRVRVSRKSYEYAKRNTYVSVFNCCTDGVPCMLRVNLKSDNRQIDKRIGLRFARPPSSHQGGITFDIKIELMKVGRDQETMVVSASERVYVCDGGCYDVSEVYERVYEEYVSRDVLCIRCTWKCHHN